MTEYPSSTPLMASERTGTQLKHHFDLMNVLQYASYQDVKQKVPTHDIQTAKNHDCVI